MQDYIPSQGRVERQGPKGMSTTNGCNRQVQRVPWDQYKKSLIKMTARFAESGCPEVQDPVEDQDDGSHNIDNHSRYGDQAEVMESGTLNQRRSSEDNNQHSSNSRPNNLALP